MVEKTDLNIDRSRTVLAFCVALAMGMFILLLSGGVPVARGYNADATTAITGLATHASFHYEMVRVLAVMAGFNKDDAEEIAVAGEAVDLGTFTGYPVSKKAKTVVVNNTNRFGPNGLFYHFGRRSSQYEKVDAPGAQSNTCDYFTNGNPSNPRTAPCTSTGPELDQLKNWAFGLDGQKPADNQLPLDAQNNPIAPKTLVALGIYLHAIGDTYSHEKCMIDAAFRFHKPKPFSCTTGWHTSPRGDFGEGTPFAKAAADEVWKAIFQYKATTSPATPRFITDFIAKKAACVRVRFAVQTFDGLTQEHTRVKCTSK